MHDVRVEGGWDGIWWQGLPYYGSGGYSFRNNQIEALNVGIYIDSSYNYGVLDNNEFFPYTFNGTTTGADVMADGNTYSVQIGRSDDVEVKGLAQFGERVDLLSNFSYGHFYGLQLDSGSDLEINGGGVNGTQAIQFTDMYQGGVPLSGLCSVNIYGGSSLNIMFENMHLRPDATSSTGASSAGVFCVGTSGTQVPNAINVDINNSYLETAATALPVVYSNQAYGIIHIDRSQILAPAAGTVAPVDIAGANTALTCAESITCQNRPAARRRSRCLIPRSLMLLAMTSTVGHSRRLVRWVLMRRTMGN